MDEPFTESDGIQLMIAPRCTGCPGCFGLVLPSPKDDTFCSFRLLTLAGRKRDEEVNRQTPRFFANRLESP
jgi:hypothetical protein